MDLKLHRPSLALVLLMLAANGCTPNEVVSLRGVVQQAYEQELPLGGAQVEILDAAGRSFDRARTDPDGAFEVQAPLGSQIYATIAGTGYIPAAFLGQSGISPVARVEDGVLFGFSTEEDQAWRTLFAGCPGADQPGAVVVGEVRFFDLAHPDTGEPPLCETGVITLELDDQVFEACYLTEDGLAWDPAATQTGTPGRFALFGLPEGSGVLNVDYRYATDYLVKQAYPVWLPADGVAPWFPAWVELPL